MLGYHQASEFFLVGGNNFDSHTWILNMNFQKTGGGGGGHNWEQIENEPEMYSC